MVGRGRDEIFVGSLEIPISLAGFHFVYLREQAVADVPFWNRCGDQLSCLRKYIHHFNGDCISGTID